MLITSLALLQDHRKEIVTLHELPFDDMTDSRYSMLAQGFKKKVAQWPTISNNRQTLADAAPGAATLQGANAEEVSAVPDPKARFFQKLCRTSLQSSAVLPLGETWS